MGEGKRRGKPSATCSELSTHEGIMSERPFKVLGIQQIAVGGLDKNPLRKLWARRYLRWLGEHRLRVMGYPMRDLIEELDAIPVKAHRITSDMVRMPFGTMYCLSEPYVVREKFRSLSDWSSVVAHH